jgi:DNA-repair protein XRCC1
MVKLVDGGNASSSLSKEDLCRKAKACKEIYEAELSSLDGSKSK